MTDSAEVFDLGFARYEEERTPHAARVGAIVRDGVRQSLGFGRGTGAKFVSWTLIVFAVLPALALVLLAALVAAVGVAADGIEIPSYPEYFDLATGPIMLLVAIIAPRLVTADRRDGVLPLYAARPISIGEYVLARWLSLVIVVFGMLVIAEGSLFLWNLFAAPDILHWISVNKLLAPRIIASSLIIAVLFSMLATLASVLTSRQGYATMITLIVIFVGSTLSSIATGLLESGPLQSALQLLGVLQIRSDLVSWLFGRDLAPGAPAGWIQLAWFAAVSIAMGAAALALIRKQVRA